jgi:allophanate hydrolase subunit 2
MLSEAQTTGGYTKIGYVIKSDLNKLSQLKPGNTIRFKKISIEQAQAIDLNDRNQLKEIRDQLTVDKDVTDYKISINGNQYDVSVEVI